MARFTSSFIGLAAVVLLSCSVDFVDIPDADPEVREPDGDGDLDSDVDADREGDGNDWGGIDGGVVAIDEPPMPVVGVCFDGREQDEREALTDCEDFECLSLGHCCQQMERAWIDGDFTACPDPAECGWTFFGGVDASDIHDEWFIIDEESQGEVGLYTPPVVELNAASEISLRASLDPETCPSSSCRQVVGLALSAQASLSGGTGVIPAAGIVIDGEQAAVSLYVAGRLEWTEPLSRERLSEETEYTLRVGPDKAIAFFVGAEEEGIGGESLTSGAWLPAQGEVFRIVLFGRVEGPGVVRAGMIELERPVCDSPRGFQRSSSQVLAPEGAESRVGHPSVVRSPGAGGLLMIHEVDDHLAASTSTDGVEWVRETSPFFASPPSSQYGRVAMRSPSVILWGPDEGSPAYHLWFEAESESRGEVQDGAPTFAIMHATSLDGVTWYVEDGEELTLVGDRAYPWRTEVRGPAVVEMGEGLMMIFVGLNPLTGETRFGRAFTTDGKLWRIDDAPLLMEPGNVPTFERDGVGAPSVIARGRTVHLWYPAYDGARSSIAYAVGQQTNASGWSWARLGPVFEPSLEWEGRRITGPAVLTLPPLLDDVTSGAEVGVLTLWYEAGRAGRERIGVVRREIPTQVIGL